MRKLFAAILLVTCALATSARADEVADLYRAKCKGCHGETGKGDTKVGRKEKVPDMTSPDWQARHSDEQIKKDILEGSAKNKKMKPYKDKLSEQEVDGLVRLIRGMKSGE